MNSYYLFSDEAGSYVSTRFFTKDEKKPYYIRTAIIIPATECKSIQEDFKSLKIKFGFPVEKEIKWSYLWSLKKSRMSGKLSEKNPYYFLKNYSDEQLYDFVDKSTRLLSDSCFMQTNIYNYLQPPGPQGQNQQT